MTAWTSDRLLGREDVQPNKPYGFGVVPGDGGILRSPAGHNVLVPESAILSTTGLVMKYAADVNKETRGPNTALAPRIIAF